MLCIPPTLARCWTLLCSSWIPQFGRIVESRINMKKSSSCLTYLSSECWTQYHTIVSWTTLKIKLSSIIWLYIFQDGWRSDGWHEIGWDYMIAKRHRYVVTQDPWLGETCGIGVHVSGVWLATVAKHWKTRKSVFFRNINHSQKEILNEKHWKVADPLNNHTPDVYMISQALNKFWRTAQVSLLAY